MKITQQILDAAAAAAETMDAETDGKADAKTDGKADAKTETKSRWWGSEEFRARISEEARRSLPGYE